MTRYSCEVGLRKRLAAWELEHDTNEFGMAHLAVRAINLIKQELEHFKSPNQKDAK